jgi:cobalamin biosynthesis Mg chelatase CobN
MRTQKRWLYAGLLLLAMAAPTGARAETSSEKVYVIPHNASLESVPAETAPKRTAPPKGHPGPRTKPSEEAPAATTTAPAGEPESREDQEAKAAAPGEGGGHPPGSAGDPKEASSPKPTARSRSGGTGQSQPEKGQTTIDAAQGGGGSSPVAPILIAVAVLAALSIGTVIYRGRREDPRPAG